MQLCYSDFRSCMSLTKLQQKEWWNLAVNTLKEWAIRGLFFVFFKQTSAQFLQKINVKKCPSGAGIRTPNLQTWVSSPNHKIMARKSLSVMNEF